MNPTPTPEQHPTAEAVKAAHAYTLPMEEWQALDGRAGVYDALNAWFDQHGSQFIDCEPLTPGERYALSAACILAAEVRRLKAERQESAREHLKTLNALGDVTAERDALKAANTRLKVFLGEQKTKHEDEITTLRAENEKLKAEVREFHEMVRVAENDPFNKGRKVQVPALQLERVFKENTALRARLEQAEGELTSYRKAAKELDSVVVARLQQEKARADAAEARIKRLESDLAVVVGHPSIEARLAESEQRNARLVEALEKANQSVIKIRNYGVPETTYRALTQVICGMVAALTANAPAATSNRGEVSTGAETAPTLKAAATEQGAEVPALLWEEDGPDRLRGYIDNPKLTLFIIERCPTKPYRGRMTGAIIPDEDERPDGLLGNALISWLQGYAAPMYWQEFIGRIREPQPRTTEGAEDGAALIAEERARQVSQEGWTPEHDDEHTEGALARAAAVYAMPPECREERATFIEGTPGHPVEVRRLLRDFLWLWDEEWYKPSKDRIRELVKAGALIVAEINRLQRAARASTQEGAQS